MKKRLLLTGALALMVGVSSCLMAQNNPVIKMEMEQAKEQTRGARSNHIVKLNPLMFLRGDVPIYYENNFSSNLSLEAGVGFTLKDYLKNSFSDSVWDMYNLDTEEKMKIGYSFRIGVRYYAANFGFEPEGLYFGLNYRYQKYQSTLTSVGSLDAMDEDLQITNGDVFLSVGFVFLFEENAFIDPYMGFGFRSRSYDKVSLNGASYQIEQEDDIVPLFVAGLKFAISL